VDALCDALKENPNNQDEWARIADDILIKKVVQQNQTSGKTNSQSVILLKLQNTWI